jgi:hypothetical protein
MRAKMLDLGAVEDSDGVIDLAVEHVHPNL